MKRYDPERQGYGCYAQQHVASPLRSRRHDRSGNLVRFSAIRRPLPIVPCRLGFYGRRLPHPSVASPEPGHSAEARHLYRHASGRGRPAGERCGRSRRHFDAANAMRRKPVWLDGNGSRPLRRGRHPAHARLVRGRRVDDDRRSNASGPVSFCRRPMKPRASPACFHCIESPDVCL